ncbi:MAG: hypothetical protein IT318_25220 [Anaerolineales bacterium]|nr:hypothetical protein [Anaerolineales bacterium]
MARCFASIRPAPPAELLAGLAERELLSLIAARLSNAGPAQKPSPSKKMA